MIFLMLMYPDPPTAAKPAIFANEAVLTANNSKSKDNTTIFSSMSSFALRVPFFLPIRHVILGWDTIPGDDGGGGAGDSHRGT